MTVQLHVPAAVPPGKRPGIHCTRGWMDLWVGLGRLSTYLANLFKRSSASSGGCGLAWRSAEHIQLVTTSNMCLTFDRSLHFCQTSPTADQWSRNSSQKTQLYLYVHWRTNYMFRPFPKLAIIGLEYNVRGPIYLLWVQTSVLVWVWHCIPTWWWSVRKWPKHVVGTSVYIQI